MDTLNQEYRRLLVDVLRQFIALCDLYHLDYCLGAGSCLGAVRHQGIIPWDDDIDVFMKRSEINKLISLRDAVPDGYKLILMNENGYPCPIPKFYNSNTTLWEDKSIESIIGVYIDIFPLDECPSDTRYCYMLKKKYIRAYSRYMDCTRVWKWYDFYEKIIHFHILGLMRVTRNVLLRPLKSRYLKKYMKLSKQVQSLAGTNMADFDGAYMAFYSKSIFESNTEVAFEGMMVKIPENYDAYLTATYGNYMELPPLEARKSHHSRYYMNLGRGMVLEEVKKELSSTGK